MHAYKYTHDYTCIIFTICLKLYGESLLPQTSNGRSQAAGLGSNITARIISTGGPEGRGSAPKKKLTGAKLRRVAGWVAGGC